MLAHLKTQQTADDAERRRLWKVRLIKGLYGRGWGRDDVRRMVRLIDWFLKLPKQVESQVREEIHAFEQELHMPYITSFERLAREEGEADGEARGEAKGLRMGIAFMLKVKFGEAGSSLMPQIQRLNDPETLRTVAESIETATTVDEIRLDPDGPVKNGP